MNFNKKPIKHHRIYAIIRGDLAYIGKTTGRQLTAAYRNHINGRCAHTRSTIGDPTQGLPRLYLLEEIDACTPIAYRHIVAWVHIFVSAGYNVVNQSGTLEYAKKLHPETATLAAQFSTEPLDVILKRTFLPRPSIADRMENREPEKQENIPQRTGHVTTQLSIRLEQEEKRAFAAYAERMKLTQRDAFMHLLRKHSNDLTNRNEDKFMLKTQRQREKVIGKLREDNDKLRKQIEIMKITTPESTAPKMTQRYRDVQAGIRDYFARQGLEGRLASPLPRYGYKRFMRNLSAGVCYDYIRNEELFVFRPKAILYGDAKPAVHFWIGRSESGGQCKIRIYTKADFVGVSPLSDKYAKQGVTWLVKTRTATDGAEDLIFALPFLSPIDKALPFQQEIFVKPSLTDQIAKAKCK